MGEGGWIHFEAGQNLSQNKKTAYCLVDENKHICGPLGAKATLAPQRKWINTKED